MDIIAPIKRGYQKNFANGEFRKHWLAYAGIFLAGMLYQSCRADDAHGYELRPANAAMRTCHERRPTLDDLVVKK